MKNHRLILVTGATGYVGGLLIPRLLDEGYSVRVLVRESGKLKAFAWSSRVEISVGDVLRADTLEPALSSVDTAYYLIHSMTSGADFAEQDLAAARNFGRAARAAGVKRLIYLGGLGGGSDTLSKHLRSRQETGKALRESGVPVTEFRAAIIVGSGSISFEMIRYLTERVPIMICPRWVRTRVQPIAIEDVLSYLVESVREPRSADQIIEVGGADVLTYGGLMKGYARVRGLHRLLLNVPVLTPRLSSYWVHWVTPISAAYARPLIEGLRSEVVVTDGKAGELFPGIKPLRYEDAVARALSELDPQYWVSRDEVNSDAPPAFRCRGSRSGMIVEVRQRNVSSSPAEVYGALIALGGPNGWPCGILWRLRGAIDRMIGGIGMRRHGLKKENLETGDSLDFFRVVHIERDGMIRLRAEMKLPGDGWLQFEVKPIDDKMTSLIQTVFFAPKGLCGLIYWYLLNPVHRLIFERMINELAASAERA